jgi:hypothetical protein
MSKLEDEVHVVPTLLGHGVIGVAQRQVFELARHMANPI